MILRRAVTILQLLGFSACQLLAAPHVHDQDPLHEHHAATPHVHLSWLFGQPEHSLLPHGGSYLHTRAPQANDWKDDDHDADAFYLPAAASATLAAEHGEIIFAKTWNARAAIQLDLVAHQMLFRALALKTDRPSSDSSVWHCAIILQLRNLRI